MRDHDSNATDPRDPADPVNRDSVSDSWGRAAAYDAYADGLHTYALGGLRHHEAASSAVYCAFVAADHHVAHLGDAEMLRPWLYAITRHFCRAGKLPRLRLAGSGASGFGAGGSAAEGWAADGSAARLSTAGPASRAPKDAAMAELERTLLSAELASLDWPDTDGLSAAHREVLELSVRHGMESRAVGMMLGKPAPESFELLSQAWHELERSLAAVALLRTSRSHCPELATLAEGWSGRLTAQRREPLVAHVDTCSRCQYHLHKVIGAPQAPSILPHVPAPKELRERVLADLLDTSPEKAAAKAAIAARLTRFDTLGFPETTPAPPRPRTATPMPVERRRRLRRGAAEPAEAPIAPRRDLAADTRAALRGSEAAADAAAERAAGWPGGGAGPSAGADEVGAGMVRSEAGRSAGADVLAELGDRSWSSGPGSGLGAGESASVDEVGAGIVRGEAGRSAGADVLAELGAERRGSGGDRLAGSAAGAGADSSTPVGTDLSASSSSSDDTLIAARRPGVFDDVRPVRPASSRGPVPRGSVAAAVEGRRRGVADARRVVAPVGDAYEAAAAVAAAVAAGESSGAEVPPIAPVGMVPTAVMPLGAVGGGRVLVRPAGGAAPLPRRRKPGVKSALASSAVLSGVGAAGVTAFVLFVPSSPSGDQALYTPSEPGGPAAQVPDHPRPSSSDAGPAVPVAGDVHSAGLRGDSVTAQVVAVALPTTPTSSASGAPSAGSSLPFNGPIDPLPSQTGAPSRDPGGQLHISVSQRSNDPGDVDVTLWNSGTSPLSWAATPDASWLSLSAGSGMLAGGAQTSIHVLVDASAEPEGPWTAHVRFDPSGQMVTISGVGSSGGGSSSPSGPGSPSSTGSSASPSGPASSTPSSPGTPPPSTPSTTPSAPHSTTPSAPRSSASSPSASGVSDSASSPSSSPSHAPSSPGTSASVPSQPSGTGPSGTGPSGTPTGSASGTTSPTATASQPSKTP